MPRRYEDWRAGESHVDSWDDLFLDDQVDGPHHPAFQHLWRAGPLRELVDGPSESEQNMSPESAA
jgi:hypothetical protein